MSVGAFASDESCPGPRQDPDNYYCGFHGATVQKCQEQAAADCSADHRDEAGRRNCCDTKAKASCTGLAGGMNAANFALRCKEHAGVTVDSDIGGDRP